jgi:NAD+ diphosphatase
MEPKHDHAGGPFLFCPSCGAADIAFLEGKRWLCQACGFEYFHNVATAAGVILDSGGEIVLLERAKEPRKGKLGLPGGFVNPGERAEDGALRECLEEIGWAPPSLSFIGSFPNRYEYRGVVYHTCDLFFCYRFPEGAGNPSYALCDGESTQLRRVAMAKLKEEDFAFTSLARALAAYKAGL